MAGSVSVENGDAYRWSNASFAWNDPQIGIREIGNIATLRYTVAAPDGFGLVDARQSGFDKPLSESFGTFDAAHHQAVLQQSSKVRFEEGRSSGFGKALTALLAVSDARTFGFSLSGVESLALSSSDAKQFSKAETDTLALVEDFGRSASFSRAYAEAVQLQSAATKEAGLRFASSFAVVDALVRRININVLVDLGFAETYQDLIGFFLSFVEGIAFDETPGKEVTIPQSDSFGVREKGLVREIELNFPTPLVLSEAFGRSASFHVEPVELVLFDDAVAKASTKWVLPEYFRTTDQRPNLATTKNAIEPIALTEAVGRLSSFKLLLNTGLSIQESASKASRLSIAQAVQIADGLRRNGDMVVSDMILSRELFDLDEFQELLNSGNIPGYERWRDFIPGDYEYREAMFRTVIESKNSDRGLLSGMQVTVDVPDLIDRGSATVVNAAGGVRVTFNRRFHIVPEMTLSVRGGVGEPAVPKITSVDTEGFNAVLESATSGALTTGSFTWAAHGY